MTAAVANWKSWLGLGLAIFALAWATYRFLGHEARRFLLLRTTIVLILLVGVVGMGVFGIGENRTGVAVLFAASAFVAAVVLASGGAG